MNRAGRYIPAKEVKMIRKQYGVYVHEYDYFTGNKDTYKIFNSLKKALKYKKEATYFIDYDHYSEAYLHGPKWTWELDEPARAHKPLQAWLDEQHEGKLWSDYLPF